MVEIHHAIRLVNGKTADVLSGNLSESAGCLFMKPASKYTLPDVN